MVIPPFATVAIITEEIIHVGKKICGTLHSKVRVSSVGFSNVSTALDPEYTGAFLVTIHNSTAIEQKLTIGKAFVTLLLSYVASETVSKMANKSNLRDHILGLNLPDGSQFITEQISDDFYNEPIKLKTKMITDPEFIQWKQEFVRRKVGNVNAKKIIIPFCFILAFVAPLLLVIIVPDISDYVWDNYLNYIAVLLAVVLTFLLTRKTGGK